MTIGMKRNRAQTEQRLLNAAMEIIRDTGFIEFGVNSIAARAGADKVLIYRYFGGAEGLMEVIAREYSLYPRCQEIRGDRLERWLESFREQFAGNHLAMVLHDWERILNNPLTEAYRKQRRDFWQEARGLLNPPTPAAHALIDLLTAMPVNAYSATSLSPLLLAAGWDNDTGVSQPGASEEEERLGEENNLPTNLL